jgi:3-(3-hydroxy-phenyl)propionate hydroxylase
MEGKAPPALLDTYSAERTFAADENIMNSTRSTDFITPKSAVSKTFRNAVLSLAERYPFARALVNSGRLSVPSFLTASALNTPDTDTFAGHMVPGAPMDDAPVSTADGQQWLLELLGNRFQLLYYLDDASALEAATAGTLSGLADGPIPIQPLVVAERGRAPMGLATVIDTKGRIRERYDLQPGTVYLVRPDQHVVARWRRLDAAAVRAALARATCNA